jgi:hypothetical protein
MKARLLVVHRALDGDSDLTSGDGADPGEV